MDKPNSEFTVFSEGDTLLERYEVLSYLGAGGMGAVYKTLDAESGRVVALKTLSANPKENAKAILRFKNEFSVMRELEHENIVQAYELHQAPDARLFIAMELIEGTDLNELIHESEEQFSFEEKLDLLLQIARGLHFAHEKGLIHRDLKPANVLISTEGAAKILDFGLARQIAGGMDLTQSNERVGTAYYMSPEQHRGEDLDIRSDIYSYGVLAYELFSRRRPFDGETAFQVFIAHVAHSIPSLRKEFPEIPRWVDTMVEICTEKEPKHRYPDMSQVIDLLEDRAGKSGGKGSLWSRLNIFG